MARSGKRHTPEPFDRECADLPAPLRWREWMGRAEAAIFASASPLSRESLALVVGRDYQLDALLADIADELRARPYELVFVGGGYQLRTKTRFAAAVRTACPSAQRAAGAPELTPTEVLAVSAIAYLQPVTRGDIARLVGKEISRDIIARLKRLDLIDAGLRAPRPGAPFAYVTTRRFLQVFGLGSLRDLPDIEQMREEGLLALGAPATIFDAALGRDDDEKRDETFGPDPVADEDAVDEPE